MRPDFRRTIVLLAGLLLMAGCQKPADFTDVQGKGHRYSDFSSRYVVVNYWATWCGPCIKEIPELNALAQSHADQLVVLGVNYDQPEGEAMLAQVQRMKIDFPVYQTDPAARLGVETPQVLPTTFIFGPGLELLATLIGPQTEDTILSVVDGVVEGGGG